MTESQAKTRWCPFARAKAVVDEKGWPAVNRMKDGKPDSDCLCIASECMAWLWDGSFSDAERRQGHCGLAQ